MIASVRRHRRSLIAGLMFLLLSMQQELALHAFEHLREQLADAHDTALHKTISDPCAECVLLSGVTHSLVDVAAAALSLAAAPDPQFQVAIARAATAPAFYYSRAPPV